MNTLRTRGTRRIVRSSGLLAIATAAAISLTACENGHGHASGQNQVSPTASAPASDGHGGGSAGTGKTPVSDDSKAPAGAGGSAQGGGSDAGSPIRTEPLPDGSKAKIYQVGDNDYRADFVGRRGLMATLETKGRDRGADLNDMFVVLSLDGHVHAWMGGGVQGPGTFTIEGGWQAEVTKLGEGHYTAKISGGQGEVGTLEANQKDDGAVANGVYIVLSAGGEISSHL